MSLASDYILRCDVDRIHRVLSTPSHWRREGKTFATLMLMLGEAHLGDGGNLYLYVGQTWRWTMDVQRDFFDILQHEGLNVEHNQDIVVCNGKIFRFVAIHNNMESIIYGHLFDKVFIDLTFDLEDKYYREIRYLKGREIRT